MTFGWVARPEPERRAWCTELPRPSFRACHPTVPQGVQPDLSVRPAEGGQSQGGTPLLDQLKVGPHFRCGCIQPMNLPLDLRGVVLRPRGSAHRWSARRRPVLLPGPAMLFHLLNVLVERGGSLVRRQGEEVVDPLFHGFAHRLVLLLPELVTLFRRQFLDLLVKVVHGLAALLRGELAGGGWSHLLELLPNAGKFGFRCSLQKSGVGVVPGGPDDARADQQRRRCGPPPSFAIVRHICSFPPTYCDESSPTCAWPSRNRTPHILELWKLSKSFSSNTAVLLLALPEGPTSAC
jgi:hypothetical protein